MEKDISKQKINQELLNTVAKIIIDSRDQVYRSSNAILLRMYWEIGQLIVAGEQNGNLRAGYGKAILKNLAKDLTLEFEKDLMRGTLIICVPFFRISNLERSACRIELATFQDY